MVPRQSQGRASRARWWSIPATPTPSPARPAAAACKFTAEIAARAIGCKPKDVFLASTGVIGEPLNAKAFDGVMEGLVAAARPEFWLDAAKAIMTTDTFPKVATATDQASARPR